MIGTCDHFEKNFKKILGTFWKMFIEILRKLPAGKISGNVDKFLERSVGKCDKFWIKFWNIQERL